MKNKKTLLIIAICCSVVAAWLDTIHNTCIVDILAAFPDMSSFMQSYILTGPALVALPIILIIGKLGDKLNTKTSLVVTTALFIVSSVGSAFVNGSTMYVIMRTIAGVANYVIVVLIYTVIFQNFKNQDESAKVMGLYQGVNTVYGTVIGIVTGYVCLISWKAATCLNAIAIIGLILIILFVPNEKNDGSAEEETAISTEPIEYKPLILALIESTLFIVLSFVWYYFASLYVAERGIGTSALVGILYSIGTLSGAIVSFLLGKIYKRFKRYGGLLCFAVTSVFYVLLGFDIPVWLVMVCSFFGGIRSGISVAYYPVVVNEYLHGNNVTFWMSVLNTLAFAAFYLCGLVPNLYMALFGGGFQRTFFINGIVMAAFSAIFFVLAKSFESKRV